ncbi:MAG: hypothetical protein WD227_16950 [Vicinamibacterales bacterium]
MADNERVDLPAEFDALLRRTLAAEPSPAFLPRVRERISEAGRPSRWMAPWTLAGGVAAAALALAIGLAWLPGAPVVDPALPAAPASATTASARPVPPLPAIQRETVRVARATTVRPARQAGESLPIVIVDQRQRAALNTFVRMAQQGNLHLAQVEPATDQAIEEQLMPIAVEPVAVSPIPVGGVLPSAIGRD